MKNTHIRPIRNDEDHAWALARIEKLMDAAPGTPEMDELEVLSQLVEIFEDQHWPIQLPSPVAAIKFRMEQAEMTRRDLEPFIGSSGKVSEVMSGKQPLTLKMIRALHKHLGIPAEVLLGDPSGQLGDDSLAVDCDKYPINEMVAKGWFESFGDTRDRCEEAVRWLITRAGAAPGNVAAYCRKNDEARHNSKMNPFAFQAWCLQALAVGAEMPVTHTYEPGSINSEVLRQVALLSVLPEGPLRAQEFLAQLGVRVVIVEHLKQTYLDGAAMLMSAGVPVIALTLRYDRLDNFWHSLLHELAHVKNDLNADCQLVYDDFSLPSAGSEVEQRADSEAADALVPRGILPRSKAEMEALDTNGLLVASRSARVHPAIVAGRIRHDTGNWRKFAKIIAGYEVKVYFEK
ncbi:MAG: helix-turn-helix domain-containing protein [Fimbriimonadaceae bacterium]